MIDRQITLSIISAFEFENAFDLKVHLTCDCGTCLRHITIMFGIGPKHFVHLTILGILSRQEDAFYQGNPLGLTAMGDAFGASRDSDLMRVEEDRAGARMENDIETLAPRGTRRRCRTKSFPNWGRRLP